MKTHVKDRGFRRIMADLDQLKGMSVLVGWLGVPAIASYMLFNEKGVENAGTNHDIVIPERPVMAQTYDRTEADYVKLLRDGQADIYAGRATPRQIMNELGVRARGDLQKAIRDFDDPGNAESTIAKKGVDNPLIDTGAAMQAVNFEVVRDRRRGG